MLNKDQFNIDPDFKAEHSYLSEKDGSRVAMSYRDTPEGRLFYNVRTGPGHFDVEINHDNTTVGRLYGPGAAPAVEGGLPIGEVSVHSKYQRRGIATQMLRLARQNMPEGAPPIVHSTELTPRGEKWVAGLKKKGID